jgi:hypothetical protein
VIGVLSHQPSFLSSEHPTPPRAALYGFSFAVRVFGSGLWRRGVRGAILARPWSFQFPEAVGEHGG